MTPPAMAGWNLALRFFLELVAMAGFGAAAWDLGSGLGRWLGVVLLPSAAAVVWGVFNVLDDPSRSGRAPVEVGGRTRLGVEVAILLGGAAAMGLATRPAVGLVIVVAILGHYLASVDRVGWLLRVRRQP